MPDINTINAELPPIEVAAASSGAKDSKSAPAKSTLHLIDLRHCRVWVGNTRDVSSDHGPRFENLKTSIKNNGQQVPVIGRKVTDSDGTDVFEIIVGKRRFVAIKSLVAEGLAIKLRVEARGMDDATAHKLVMSENEGRYGFVPIETALYYRHGLANGLYADQAALAAALGLNKSTVGRTLSILDLPTELLDKVADRRAISAAQAAKFMTLWNDLEHQAVVQITLSMLPKANAATTFKAVFAAVDSSTSENELRTVDGVTLGTLRVTKAGLKIELSVTADDVEADDIVASIRERILALRTRD